MVRCICTNGSMGRFTGYEGSDEEKIDQLWATLLKLCRIEGVSKERCISSSHGKIASSAVKH